MQFVSLCTARALAALGAYIEQLGQEMQAGTAAAEIQKRYDALNEIARSIQSPYFAGVD